MFLIKTLTIIFILWEIIKLIMVDFFIELEEFVHWWKGLGENRHSYMNFLTKKMQDNAEMSESEKYVTDNLGILMTVSFIEMGYLIYTGALFWFYPIVAMSIVAVSIFMYIVERYNKVDKTLHMIDAIGCSLLMLSIFF